MPTWVTVTYCPNDGQPSLMIRLETRHGRPQLVGLSLSADDDEREIREGDLRNLERVGIDTIVRDVLALVTFQLAPDDKGRLTVVPDNDASYTETLDLIHNLRKGRAIRTMTPAFLKRVAKVYKEHPETPRRAVANVFEVTDRTASKYIGLARDKGYIPPPKRGRRTDMEGEPNE